MNKRLDSQYWQLVWEKFKQGDQHAFETLYKEFEQSLFAYGSRLTSDRELLKDSVHDLFIRLYNYRSNLSSEVNLQYYLLVSLKRVIYRKLVQENRFSSIQEMSQTTDLILSIEQDAFKEDEKERLKQIKTLINNLQASEKQLLFLKFNSGMTYKEIGKLLEVKPNTLQKKIYVILNHIRNQANSKITLLWSLCCRT